VIHAAALLGMRLLFLARERASLTGRTLQRYLAQPRAT
jgi:hypothetical protein